MAEPTAVTRAESDVLSILQFRADLGQTWAIPEPRGRAALVVPSMLTRNPLHRLRAVNLSTLQGLADRGLIVMEHTIGRPRYGYAKPTVPGTYCWRLSMAAEEG